MAVAKVQYDWLAFVGLADLVEGNMIQ